MANKPTAMLQIRRIIQLLEAGKPQREISRALGISRNTVQQYTQRITESARLSSELLSLSDAELSQVVFVPPRAVARDTRYERLAPNLEEYSSRLQKTGVTRLLLWQEYRKFEPEGYSYQQFCEHLNRRKKISQAVMHFEHAPGACMQIDYAGKKLHYTDQQSGEVIECPVLVVVLPHSSYTYVEALRNCSMSELIPALNRALHHFGGVPHKVLCDNMRQTVKASTRYDPTFTDLADQWSFHYNTCMAATRVRKPRDKATVEKSVHLTYQRVFAPLSRIVCYSLQELNHHVNLLVDDHNNAKMQRREHSRYDLWLQEKETLITLPEKDFEITYRVNAKVQKNYHVTLGQDWHHYSVPFNYIGSKVSITYTTEHVAIYCGLDRIALHTRDRRKQRYSTIKEHMPAHHAAYHQTLGWDADYFPAQAQHIGPHAIETIKKVLASRYFPEQAYRSCIGILRLRDRYGSDRLESACFRALHGDSIRYKTIANILANGMDKLPINEPSSTSSIPPHDNIRGPLEYSQL